MSTLLRHEQPSWVIIYDEEEDHVVHGQPGEWQKYASVQDVDGLQAYVLKEQVKAIIIQDGAFPHVLSAPESTSFFSFMRSRTRLSDTEQASEWLFTVFGYLLPDYRVYLTVLPSHTEYHCEPRTTPFLVV